GVQDGHRGAQRDPHLQGRERRRRRGREPRAAPGAAQGPLRPARSGGRRARRALRSRDRDARERAAQAEEGRRRRQAPLPRLGPVPRRPAGLGVTLSGGSAAHSEPQHPDPGRPAAASRRGAAEALCPIEGVLDQRVVERAVDERPGQARPAAGLHAQVVLDPRQPLSRRLEAELVIAVEALGAEEAEADAPLGLVDLDRVADRTVAAAAAHRERAVELHPRPAVARPEGVLRRRQGGDQGGDPIRGSAQGPGVEVDDHVECCAAVRQQFILPPSGRGGGTLPVMETLLSVLIGLGLSAACGFRVFVPLLVASLAARSGHLHLWQGLDWIGSTPALIAFAVATGLEIAGYYIPWVDHLLDAVATPTAIVSGVVLTASALAPGMDPFLRWTVALIAGGGTAAIFQGVT